MAKPKIIEDIENLQLEVTNARNGKANLKTKIDEIDTTLTGHTSSLAESLSYKKAQGLVSDYNTTTKTGTNNTPILQGLINTLQTQIRTDGFGKHDNVIAIPSGYYYFASTVNISPIIKLKPIGQVIFVFGGTGKFLAYECGNEPAMWHEWWNSGSLIDGMSGALTINSNTTVATTGTIAISLGNTTTGKTVFSRYLLNDLAIGNFFDIGIQFEGYDHYLGNFERVHIEGCNTIINCKDAVYNSGENFTFYKCIFAGATQSVINMNTGFDLLFDQCSFDYNNRILQYSSTSNGWSTVRFANCYFERIYDVMIYGDGISTPGHMKPQITFLNGLMYANRKTLFKCGTRGFVVHLKGFEFRYELAEQSQAGKDTFMVDTASAGKIEIYYRDIEFSHLGAWQMVDSSIAPSMNFSDYPTRYPVWSASKVISLGAVVKPTVDNGHYYKCTTAGTTSSTQPTWNTGTGSTTSDGTVVWTEFALSTLSIKASTLQGCTVVSTGSISGNDSIVTDNYCTGTSSLHVIGTSDSNWFKFRCDDKIRVGYNDKVVISNIHKVVDGGTNPTINIQYDIELYDSTDTLLDTISMCPDNTGINWSANATTVLGYVRNNAANTRKFICTTSGVTGTTEPTWNTGAGSTTTDGTVVWTELSTQWYSSHRMTINGLTRAEYRIKNPKCTYVKITPTYSSFMDIYIEQISVNVIKS